MYLKTLTLRGFKSFPERTTLEFGPGVSVVVGPNGSGKSNITDAILWALGEQSPTAVRGQAMQDVIFGGGQGSAPRSAAEVELVLDNQHAVADRLPAGDVQPRAMAAAGPIAQAESVQSSEPSGEQPRAALLGLSEISISRRLDRDGDGEYRLNGARCRLTDALEALSDTGLGKEAHSVVSQGRIESIVTSRPRDLRILLEEAAGLAKYRKRRRQARLKIDRTRQNLDRALDVEREARARLRPLERQARAAELHARLERQVLEAREVLLIESHRTCATEQQQARAAAEQHKQERAKVDERLREVMERRESAESALGQRSEQSEQLTRGLYKARGAAERMAMRGEQMQTLRTSLEQRIAGAEQQIAELALLPERNSRQAGSTQQRLQEIEAQMAESERLREQELKQHSAQLEQRVVAAQTAQKQAEAAVTDARAAAERARQHATAERSGLLWRESWSEVKRLLQSGLTRLLGLGDKAEREQALEVLLGEAEGLAQTSIEHALGKVDAAERLSAQAAQKLREQESAVAKAREDLRQAQWQLSQKRAESEHGAHALRSAALQGELAAERRQAEQSAHELVKAEQRRKELTGQVAAQRQLFPVIEQLFSGVGNACEAAQKQLARLQAQADSERSKGAALAAELRQCARQEAEVQSLLRVVGDRLTEAEIAAGRAEARAAESARELQSVVAELVSLSERIVGASSRSAEPARESVDALETVEAEAHADESADQAAVTAAASASAGEQRAAVGDERPSEQAPAVDLEQLIAERPALSSEEREALEARLQRLLRRRQALGPINPLAEQEYAEAQGHVQDLLQQREDLEAAMRELSNVIREADRRIRESFDQTFSDVSRHFSEVIGEVFPGGRGALKLVAADQPGTQDTESEPPEIAVTDEGPGEQTAAQTEQVQSDPEAEAAAEGLMGVQIEVTPAGKTPKSLSLLSGGEKSMTALAFLFSLFLARPCPFYVLDEVEAALDDLSLERFLALLRRCAAGAQFIVITHQKRTMEAAEWLYGVSMGSDGISKVISRRLGAPADEPQELLAATM